MDNPDQYTGVNTAPTQEQALEFASSQRGNYIVAQALYYGIKALEAVKPEHMQEKSNISDMKYLLPAFPFPQEFFDGTLLAEMKEKLG